MFVASTRQLQSLYPVRILNGWELKCYSVIHLRFEEVLLLDADNVPIVDPTFLFDARQYGMLGAIFWPDYGRLQSDRLIWQLTGVQYRHESEFETGQLVVNKARCWHELQLAMWMNEYSDFWFQHIHGDKETFHLAWRKMNRDYAMPARGVHGLPGVMCQHDFENRRIFQHRNMAKWTLTRDNTRISGFYLEDDCLAYLSELDSKWLGRPGRPYRGSDASVGIRAVADSLCATTWLYRRIGHDHREMRFLPNGSIGEGSAGCEKTWNLFALESRIELRISGNDQLTCILSRIGDIWRGKWLVHEKMPVELVPARLKDMRTQHRAP